jgi:putative phosphoesterase
VIYIVSDSHCALNYIIRLHLKYADNIIHAGDWSSYDTYEDFIDFCPNVYGVHGNTDTAEIELKLPSELDFELFEIKIHLEHELSNTRKFTQSSVKPDIVISGHTHKPKKKKLQGICFYNPGSCGPKRFPSVSPSFGLMFVFGKKIFIHTVKIPFQSRYGYY